MIDESKWINPYHGMELHEGFQFAKRDNENGVVFFAEYILLKQLKGLSVIDNINQFDSICKSLQTYDITKPVKVSYKQIPGLYDRGAGESLIIGPEKLRTISHDNLTAIAAISKKYNLPYAKDIAKHGWANFWRFDNAYPKSPRWSRIHRPRDWCFWMFCGGCPGWVALYPWFLLINIISCLTKKENTSGKLLVFIRFEATYKKSWAMRFGRWCCWKLLKRKYGEDWLKQLMEIYFRDPKHPNRIISKV